MSKPITENIIEESAIEILQSQGWEYANVKEVKQNQNVHPAQKYFAAEVDEWGGEGK